MRIGITEAGDAGLHLAWVEKLRRGDVAGAILYTKSPQILTEMEHRGELPKNTVVHCDITGLGASVFEPGVQHATETIKAYNSLVDRLGPERCVLRVDPIIPFEPFIQLAANVICQAQGRVNISFLDMYNHVIERFARKRYFDLIRAYKGQRDASLDIRKRVLDSLQTLTPNEFEVCGEAGIECSGCVSERDVKAMGLDIKREGKCQQRPACNCWGNKTELLSRREPCAHACLYCYWR